MGAWIVVEVQEVGQCTFSDIADDLYGKGWSNLRVKPFVYLNFFPTVAIMILIGGNGLYTRVQIGRQDELLSRNAWGVIMGAVVFLISLIPDLSKAWPVSVF